ncbi:WcaG Nucleoside-diphosphate-sugar epimerases [Candidatus Nanopelagicaceae bacterium]
MHYLVTGHTGFKGTWLSSLLLAQGHKVSGISLDPEPESLFNQADIKGKFEYDFRIDIRNANALKSAVEEIQPEIVIHLAAQPLVRRSYAEPELTFETNFGGTLNVLSAITPLESLKACLIITTDKVYQDTNLKIAYVETDALGGGDPYSASKSAADIMTQSWIKSVSAPPIAIARAGNVIGGGDWSLDRLVPDSVTAILSGKDLVLRNPDAIRPWQHVLDCLNGYLLLVNSMLTQETEVSWNFGPLPESIRTVKDVADSLIKNWGATNSKVKVEKDKDQLKESNFLLLNSSKSREKLGWTDILDFEETMQWTTSWYKSHSEGISAEALLSEQVNKFIGLSTTR